MISLIELRTISEDNFSECLDLTATVEEENFVDSVVYSLAEAWLFYNDTKPFAIYENDKMIGFVSMYVGEENYQIINLLIDDAYQQNGFGTQAAKACIDFLRDKYEARKVSAPVKIEHGLAQEFWLKLGFDFSNNIENGYVFMRLYL